MQRVIATGAVLVLAAAAAAAQPAEPRRIVGTAMSGRLELNAAATASIETATLEFGDAPDAPAFTVEFAAQYAVALPAPPPAIVDMIVTERPNGHSAARVTLQVNDDEPQPLVARRRGATNTG